MRLDVRFSGTKAKTNWNLDLEKIIIGSLNRFQHWVRHICLYIEDVNGPKGGVDKQCRCVVHMRKMPPVVIQAEANSMPALIYRVTNRASHTLSQKTKRKRDQKSQRSSPTRQVFESDINKSIDEEGLGIEDLSMNA